MDDWRAYVEEFERLSEKYPIPEEVKELFMEMAHELGSCEAALDSDDQLNK